MKSIPTKLQRSERLKPRPLPSGVLSPKSPPPVLPSTQGGRQRERLSGRGGNHRAKWPREQWLDFPQAVDQLELLHCRNSAIQSVACLRLTRIGQYGQKFAKATVNSVEVPVRHGQLCNRIRDPVANSQQWNFSRTSSPRRVPR